MRRRFGALALIMTSALVSGCGLSSMALPLAKGGGNNDIRVTAILANADTLVPNSEVKYDDVTVGSVRSIAFDGWHARLTLGIDHSADVPNNVTAAIAQKSLLGAEYVELVSPPQTPATAPLLKSGDVLDLHRTGTYPSTEQLLSATALLLNNGGLNQLHTIAHELNLAFNGRTRDVTSLVHEVSTFTGALATQRGAILGTLTDLDRIAASVDSRRTAVTKALDTIPAAVQVLAKERRQLVAALGALNTFSGTVHTFVTDDQSALAQNLANLKPLTKQLADHARSLALAVNDITFPFPIKAINNAFFGDYINFFATLNINATELAKDWTGGTALDMLLGSIVGLPTLTSTSAATPLAVPTPGSTPARLQKTIQGLLDGFTTSTTAPGQKQGGSSNSVGNLLGNLLGGSH